MTDNDRVQHKHLKIAMNRSKQYYDEKMNLIYSKLSSKNNALDSQIKEKANKGDSILVSQIDKNKGKFDQTYMTEEFLQQMAGNTPINANVVLRGVTTEKLSSLSVTPNETNFFNPIINLFDKTTCTEGKEVDRNNGDLKDWSISTASDYIMIEPNTQYKVNYFDGSIASYDSSKNFISGSGAQLNKASSYAYTTPSNACYIRFNIVGTGNQNKAMFTKSIYDNSIYKPYGITTIKNDYLDMDYINDNIELKQKSITPTECTFFGNILNLFDASTAIVGSSLNTTDGTILTGTDYENNYVSDWIYINDYVSTIYTNKNLYKFCCFYDKDKKFISKGLEGNGDTNTTITVPNNAKYLRIAGVDQANIPNQYVSENERPIIKYEYNTSFLKKSYINSQDLYGFKNKKLTTFGHSVVAMNLWQPYVAKELGFTHVNCGIGSSTVSGVDGSTGSNPMWTDERINAIPEDSDYILILAGLNDQKDIDNMGTIDDITTKDTNTFYGAYATVIEKLYTRCPEARIVIMTDIHRDSENWGVWKGEDYRIATRNIAYHYGLPVIEMKQLCGFNKLNEDVFYADGVHPNVVGGKRMAEVVIGFLKTISPIN